MKVELDNETDIIIYDDQTIEPLVTIRTETKLCADNIYATLTRAIESGDVISILDC